MAEARSVRRLRSAESANSRSTALRDVPRRAASASTSLRRSSGIDTITFAMPTVYRGIQLERNGTYIRRSAPPVRPTTHGLRADKYRSSPESVNFQTRGERLDVSNARAPARLARFARVYLFFLPLPPALVFFLAFFGLAVAFGHPVTPIFVACLITAPFWPVIVVGISSGGTTCSLTERSTCLSRPLRRTATRLRTVTVFVAAHRLPFAVSAECGPSGRLSSNVLTGVSGTVSNLE